MLCALRKLAVRRVAWQHVISELYRCGPSSLKWFPQQYMHMLCAWEKCSNFAARYTGVCDVTHTKLWWFQLCGRSGVGISITV